MENSSPPLKSDDNLEPMSPGIEYLLDKKYPLPPRKISIDS